MKKYDIESCRQLSFYWNWWHWHEWPARLLLSQQVTVTGSDLAFNAVIEGLIKEGAIIHKGQ